MLIFVISRQLTDKWCFKTGGSDIGVDKGTYYYIIYYYKWHFGGACCLGNNSNCLPGDTAACLRKYKSWSDILLSPTMCHVKTIFFFLLWLSSGTLQTSFIRKLALFIPLAEDLQLGGEYSFLWHLLWTFNSALLLFSSPRYCLFWTTYHGFPHSVQDSTLLGAWVCHLILCGLQEVVRTHVFHTHTHTSDTTYVQLCWSLC